VIVAYVRSLIYVVQCLPLNVYAIALPNKYFIKIIIDIYIYHVVLVMVLFLIGWLAAQDLLANYYVFYGDHAFKLMHVIVFRI